MQTNDTFVDASAFKRRFPQYADRSDSDIQNLARAARNMESSSDIQDSEYAPTDAEFNQMAGIDTNKTTFKNVSGPAPLPVDPFFQAQQERVQNGGYDPQFNALLQSIAHGGSELTHGITGPILESLPESTGLPEGSRRTAQQRQLEQEALREGYPGTELAGNILGKGLITAPAALLSAPAAGAGFIERAGTRAIGGLLSGLAEYGPLKHRLEQGMFNAGGAAFLPEILKGPGEALSRGTAKLSNFFKENIPQYAKEIIDYGKKFDVPVYAPDVVHPASKIGKAGRLSEKTVFNTVDKRLQQQEAAGNAATKTLEDYKNEMLKSTSSDKQWIAKLRGIAAAGGKRAKAAQELLEQINNAGSDWNSIIKASGNSRLLQQKIQADQLYNRVSKLAAQKGNIDLTRVVKKLDAAIARLKKFPEVNKDALASLRATRKDLISKTKATPASSIVNAQGQPAKAATTSKEVAKKLSFDELREIRSTLNDKISDYYTGKNTLIGKKGVKSLIALRDEIEKEMESFATNNGSALKNAWKDADKFYKQNVIPYKDKALVKALNAEKSPDEIFKMFVASGGAEGDFGTGRALKLYKALDPKGQAAVRYGILKQATEKATNDAGQFSPAKFATVLDKLEASRGVFFKGTPKYEIEGLKRLMRAVQRSGQVTPPETGVQTIGYLLAGSLAKLSLAAPGAAIGTLGASGVLNTLLTTPKGRNFLLAASRLDANSPKWAKLLSSMGDFVAKSGEVAGTVASRNTKAVGKEIAEKVSGATGYGKNTKPVTNEEE